MSSFTNMRVLSLTEKHLSLLLLLILITGSSVWLLWHLGSKKRPGKVTDSQHATLEERQVTYRVRGVPLQYKKKAVKALLTGLLNLNNEHGLHIQSLAIDATELRKQVATIDFKSVPIKLIESYSDSTITRKYQKWQLDITESLTDSESESDISGSQIISIDTNFIGITTLFSPSPENHKVDIVAISGLGSHAFGSFKERNGEHMWLRDSLPFDIPTARVLVCSYDTRVYKSDSFQDLEALGRSLCADLEVVVVEEDPKPVVFIGHSLGGLIIKQAIIQMHHGTTASQNILYSKHGALFFGVPNQGMDIKSLIPMTNDQPNQALLHSLGTESQVLRDLGRQFPKAFNFGDAEIVCFYETQESPTAIKVDGRWLLQGPPTILVGSASATHSQKSLQYENGENLQPINKTHSELVKFKRHDENYTKVQYSLKRLVKSSQLSIRREPSPDEVKLQESIYAWLTPPDPETNHIRAFSSKKLETGTWFTDNQKFAAWKTEPSILWLYGIPGCGKTVLSATIIEATRNLVDRFRKPFAYYYFDFNDERKQTVDNIIRSLICQLSMKKLNVCNSLKGEYATMNARQSTPTLEKLQGLLDNIVTEHDDIFIILDALDECKERPELLTWLRGFFQKHESKIHIIVTSRKEVIIERYLGSNEAVHQIPIQTQEVDSDIQLFVRDQLEQHPELSDLRSDLKDEVSEKLAEKAGGMFRWVVCQVNELKNCVTYGDIKSALDTLPRTLDETYERALKGIREDFQEDAARIFQWLVFSAVPLRLNEIAEVFKTKPGEEDGVDHERSLVREDIILQYCGTLVTTQDPSVRDLSSDEPWIRDSTTWIKPKNSKELRLAHFSVQEYLTSDRIPQDCSKFSIRENTSHVSIAGTCLNYLFDTFKEFHSEKLPKDFVSRYPLAPYAAEYWPLHIKGEGKWYDALIFRVLQFLKNDQLFSSYLCLVNHEDHIWEGSFYREITDTPSHIPLLYVTSFYGLTELSVLLLEHGAYVNAQGGDYGNALQAASYGGHEGNIRLLLEHGADVNALGGPYGNALQAASFDGHEGTIRLLLEHGADVNAPGGDYGNALQAASFGGHEDTITLLLEHGANVNAQGGYYGNALQASLLHGHEDTIRLLLEHGADVNAQGGYYGTALQAASFYGHEDTIRFLLEHGADVNAQGGGFGNALQAASLHCHEGTIRLLLEHGADVNAQGEFNDNALQAASFYGHEGTIRLLLEHGADVNAQGGYWGNALQAASLRGHEGTIRLLLEHGADVNAQGGSYGNPLRAAIQRGHKTIVRILKQAGAAWVIESHESSEWSSDGEYSSGEDAEKQSNGEGGECLTSLDEDEDD